MIRVLIVDDNAVARDLLTQILLSAGSFEIVAEAKDGLQAVELARRLRPDLILMDIHMPNMDGFEATQEIMIAAPTPIVIVSASTMVHEVEVAMRALRAGALTLLLKPPGPNSPDFEEASQELIDVLRTMSDVKVVRRISPKTTKNSLPEPTFVAARHVQHSKTNFDICVIAASTGGPPALQKLLMEIPVEFPVPILLVQHMAAGFLEGFVRWLDSSVQLRVKSAVADELMRRGTVYVGPENQHMGISADGRIALSGEPRIGGFRPSATHLFQSAADAYGARTLALILTGMGTDGLDGLQAIHKVGGTIFAQDEATSVVYGMPSAAVAAGIVSRILPLDEIAPEVLRFLTA